MSPRQVQVKPQGCHWHWAAFQVETDSSNLGLVKGSGSFMRCHRCFLGFVAFSFFPFENILNDDLFVAYVSGCNATFWVAAVRVLDNFLSHLRWSYFRSLQLESRSDRGALGRMSEKKETDVLGGVNGITPEQQRWDWKENSVSSRVGIFFDYAVSA